MILTGKGSVERSDADKSILNDQALTTIKGIGDKTAKLFSLLGVDTVDDLIGFFPVRFLPYENVISIEEAQPDTNAAVTAVLLSSPHTIRAGRLKITEAVVEDYSGKLRCVWYNSPFVASGLRREEEYVFAGRLTKRKNQLVLEHPLIYKSEEYRKIAGKLRPVYHLTKGLSQKTVSKAVRAALEAYSFEPDFLPEFIRSRYGLMDYETAVRTMHLAENREAVAQARHRLVFEEFFTFLYGVKHLKESSRENASAFRLSTERICEEILPFLPFSLTEDQKNAEEAMLSDMSSGRIMNRLIQGDVGSGKTVLALIALYAVYRNGFQGAMMAPTEVLARQHFHTFTSLLEKVPHAPEIVLLTGSMSKSEKQEAWRRIAQGEADIVLGTHALIQEGVEFRNLALVITDEQHRFGVRQREVFSEKGHQPHIAVMSATPIPRTLAVILFGDLDISTIHTVPAGRLPIKNAVITPQDRGKAYRTILNEIEKGHQAYIICPMVEEGEMTELENVLDYSEKIKAILPQNIVVQFLHGRMIQSEKDRIMSDFSRGDIDILVSTTVVEVGVDVPNATVMMIENAERYGLASLHQLRGRVGRGKDQSYCIFVRTSDSDAAKKRLRVVGESNDGFFIAKEDLRLRGPGEILGQEQSGQMKFRQADIYADAEILKEAYECCETVDSSAYTDKDKEYLKTLWERIRTKLDSMLI